MDRSKVALRDAEPLYEEGVVFARTLDAIAPFYRVMLGRRVVEIIAKAFPQPGHDLSYQNTIFAECNVGRHLETLRRKVRPRRLR